LPQPSNNSRTVSAIVLTVALDEKIADTLVTSMEAHAWQVTAAQCDAYVSPARRPSIASQVDSVDTCLAFVNFDRDQQEAIDATRYLHQIFAGRITVIAISKSNDPSLLLAAMRAGCSEFLHEPLLDEPLRQMLERLHSSLAQTDDPREAGSVLSLFGAKGGVGTTTIGIHLAMYLAQIHKKKTLFVDNQPELGHACIYLGLEGSQYTFREVIKNVHRLDSELLRGLTAKHSSGLEVLSSPDSCEDSMYLDATSMTRTLEFLRSEYDYVIIDGPLTSDEATKAVIELSTHVYLVATPDIGSVRDLARQVERLCKSDEVAAKIHVVMNRFSAPAAVTTEQIRKVVKVPMAFTLPSSYPELVHADNLGKPLSPDSKSEFAVQLVRWAASLAGVAKSAAPPQPTKKTKSLFGSLKMGLPNVQIHRRVSTGA